MTQRPGGDCPSAWEGVRGVILDLDGTLYDQRRLRALMAWQLMLHCLLRPRRVRDALLLMRFRRHREALADRGEREVGRRQYEVVARECRCDVRRVAEVVEDWMQRRPLQMLPSCRYDFVDALLSWLAEKKIAVAVLSDYPPSAKLEALGWGRLASCASTDPEIDRLKPDPSGLLHICRRWNLQPEQCLVIGDRDERDGEAARRAGMRYLVASRGLDFRSMEHFFQEVSGANGREYHAWLAE